MMPTPIVVTALVFGALCMASDLRSRRIPNALSGCGMLAGVALNAFYFGGSGLGASAAGFAVALLLLLLPFALGGIGGGDVKMMAAMGALLGLQVTLLALGAGLALGGVIMSVHLLRLGRLRQTVRTVGAMATASALTGSLEPLRMSPGAPGTITLPYSVPLGLGTLLALAVSGRMAP
jgi:prepilin peptidase CpaA